MQRQLGKPAFIEANYSIPMDVLSKISSLLARSYLAWSHSEMKASLEVGR